MDEAPFLDLPHAPATHFRLHYFGSVSLLLAQVAAYYDSPDKLFERFSFLAGYHEQLAAHGAPVGDVTWWRDGIRAWEKADDGEDMHLPLRALRAWAELDVETTLLLVAIGLIEEDARFGLLFEALQSSPGVQRPTVGLLDILWSDGAGDLTMRDRLRSLRALGLVQVSNPDAPRTAWQLQVPAPIWDALRGDIVEKPTPWLHHRAAESLASDDALVIDDALRSKAMRVPALLESKQVNAVIVRGPRHNGRRALLGSIAKASGRGLLEANGLGKTDDERWRLVAPLATLLHALPAIVLDPSPGETITLPEMPVPDGGLGFLLDRSGGVVGASIERALTLQIELPDVTARRALWDFALPEEARGDELDAIAESFRMTSGNLRRAAELARSCAALDERGVVTFADVREASRMLHRQALDVLATRVPSGGDFTQIATAADTMNELTALVRRCRHRERLQTSGGVALSGLSAGVRALFKGPSGTGKTMAARLLASVLKKDLYRIDLSAVVNKYIGETEKNLSRIFAIAEELDVILLFDEGDALLARRTNVQSSNDRYANLETNFLLQRIEAYQGIFLLTTNAAALIDEAFERRMDAVIEFRPPEVAERYALWQLHLPEGHAIDAPFLREVAQRCKLTGGQIRNAAIHAAALALDASSIDERGLAHSATHEAGTMTTPHLEVALQREYRKAGTVCPLRQVMALVPGIR